MANYIPRYIKAQFAYKKGELVTAEDYNNILNLLVAASDYNTTILDSICNNADFKAVINTVHADEADHSLVADNSAKLSDAVLSRSAVPLENNDNTIPSSKQVKDYVDNIQRGNSTNFGSITERLSRIDTLNTTQDSRLANIDLINNQYGNRISALENRVDTNATAITSIRNTNLSQDNILAQHNQRITNLELGDIPTDVLETVMLKGSYAYITGSDASGDPIYSANTVARANVALNLLVDGDEVSANSFAFKTNVETLVNNSFLTRGAMPNANSTYYTVGELKQLKHGSYELTAAQSTALHTGNAAGTLRLYPCGNGLSLEFEVQAGTNIGRLYTMFIPSSTSDNTGLNTLTWYDENTRIGAVETRLTTVENNRLVIGNLNAGTDINVVKNGNNATFNYTGPKIVISTSQPAADPNRQTLWIAI